MRRARGPRHVNCLTPEEGEGARYLSVPGKARSGFAEARRAWQKPDAENDRCAVTYSVHASAMFSRHTDVARNIDAWPSDLNAGSRIHAINGWLTRR